MTATLMRVMTITGWSGSSHGSSSVFPGGGSGVGEPRTAADAAGVDLVINARTDAFLGKAETFDDPVAEAVARMQACEAAGSRCSYPVGAPDAEAVRTLLAELSGPINVIAHPVHGSAVGSLADIEALGVHRISFGPLLQMTLTESINGLVTPWLSA